VSIPLSSSPRASPKSQILRSQLELSRILDGFRSRWITLAECMYLFVVIVVVVVVVAPTQNQTIFETSPLLMTMRVPFMSAPKPSLLRT
jgi:hypothetical protein